MLLVYPCLVSLGSDLALSNFHKQIQIALTMVFGSFIAGSTARRWAAVRSRFR
ncbi:hypothetical protein [Pseudoalteromonas rubra]|uniref:hypothetical protein n=1 Tax=Pseudoalteromonas rubra TaxID=43658 RepID=UPI0013EE9530|nr:hypothetical protein [Pseudoalteromonas rubra]